MELPKPTTMKIDNIKEYENNPRIIGDEAVGAVKTSIEDYGYVQPIVVDQRGVVIAGHTRLAALRELGHEQVEVFKVKLTKDKAKQYRLVDNRTHELTDWAHSSLVAELREFEDSTLREFFPDVSLEVGAVERDEITEEDIEWGEQRAGHVSERPDVPLTDVECPSCRGVFQVKTGSLPGILPEDLIR